MGESADAPLWRRVDVRADEERKPLTNNSVDTTDGAINQALSPNQEVIETT